MTRIPATRILTAALLGTLFAFGTVSSAYAQQDHNNFRQRRASQNNSDSSDSGSNSDSGNARVRSENRGIRVGEPSPSGNAQGEPQRPVFQRQDREEPQRPVFQRQDREEPQRPVFQRQDREEMQRRDIDAQRQEQMQQRRDMESQRQDRMQQRRDMESQRQDRMQQRRDMESQRQDRMQQRRDMEVQRQDRLERNPPIVDRMNRPDRQENQRPTSSNLPEIRRPDPSRSADQRPNANPPRMSRPQQENRVTQQRQMRNDWQRQRNNYQYQYNRYAEQYRHSHRGHGSRYLNDYWRRWLAQQNRWNNYRWDYYNNAFFYTPYNYRYSYGGNWYYTNSYGISFLQQAIRDGYREGWYAGRADRSDRWRFDYRGSYAYMDGSFGYYGYYTDLGTYQYYFRQGFERGYRDGYYNRYQYGRYDNGAAMILPAILSAIFTAALY